MLRTSTTARVAALAALAVGAAACREFRIAGDAGEDDAGAGAADAPDLSPCPCSLWPDEVTPLPPDPAPDDWAQPIELGVRFRAEVAGVVTGLRFYKLVGNTGAHVGRLWAEGGDQLGTYNFTGETAEGWQQSTFSEGVPVSAGQVYVASYLAPAGHYAIEEFYFTVERRIGPITALVDTAPEEPNGLFAYNGGFPTDGYNASNYWVDVVFEPD